MSSNRVITKQRSKFWLLYFLSCGQNRRERILRWQLHLRFKSNNESKAEDSWTGTEMTTSSFIQKLISATVILPLLVGKNGTWNYSFKSIVERKAKDSWMGTEMTTLTSLCPRERPTTHERDLRLQLHALIFIDRLWKFRVLKLLSS